MRHPLRRKNLSPKLLPLYALAAAWLWLADPSVATLALGALPIAAGQALRLWGAGHLVKTEVLTVTGPYAHLRHPLYLGTLLLAVGFGLAAGGAGGWLLLAVFLPVYSLYYFPYKERVESERLLRRYGESYAAYRAQVPALLPRLLPWSPPRGFPAPRGTCWRRAAVIENDEFGTLLGVVTGVALLACRPLW